MNNQNEQQQTEVVFKPIAGFPGYWARSDGTVWSSQKKSWRRLKEWKSSGYWYVGPFRDGKQIKYTRAYFVLRAFHPQPDPIPGRRLVCRHLDGNPENDLPGNLAWGTHQDNNHDVLHHGRRQLSVKQVWRIRELAREGVPYLEIDEIVGCKAGTSGRVGCGGVASYLPNPDGSRFIPIKRAAIPMAADLKSRVAIELQAGQSIRKIAKRLGVTRNHVWNHVKRLRNGDSSV